MLESKVRSEFVSANAGSGKTGFLISKIFRIIFTGEDPSKILCTTYTNAGVEELKTRVQDVSYNIIQMHKKGSQHSEIVSYITSKCHINVHSSDVPQIIQHIIQNITLQRDIEVFTFHSFCSSFYKKYISPASYTLITEPQIKPILYHISNSKNFFTPDIFEVLEPLKQMSSYEYEGSVNNIINSFSDIASFAGVSFNDYDTQLRSTLELPEIPDDIEAEIRSREKYAINICIDFLAVNVPYLDEKNIPSKLQDVFTSVANAKYSEVLHKDLFDMIKQIFFTGKGSVRKDIIKKGTSKASKEKWSLYEAQFQGIASEIHGIIENIVSLEIYTISRSMFILIKHLLNEYHNYKRQHNLQDYDDIIADTHRHLVTHPDKDSYLFGLDFEYNHILVDESQDTNDIQWEIIGSLVSNFFADEQNLNTKSLTIVGDGKQSIFSFQGAKSYIFDKVKKDYSKNLQNVQLQNSYRSSPGLMNFVNHACQEMFGNSSDHRAFHDFTGLVKLHPQEIIDEEDRKKSDVKSEALGLAIADQINIALQKYQPSNIMVLFAKRDSRILSHIADNIQAPINSLNQSRIENSFFILDLISTVRAFISGDKFALSVIMKKFCGTNDLETVGANLSAFENLRRLQNVFEHENLTDFINYFYITFANQYNSSECAEFEMFMGMLGEFFEGSFCHPSINESGYALAERFVAFCEVIMSSKIATPSDSNAIQVKTIHGSKGLEAKCVIIADASFIKKSDTTKEVFNQNPTSQEVPFFMKPPASKSAFVTPRLVDIIHANKEIELKESYNLLYVAITRAAEELHIFYDSSKEAHTWIEVLTSAMSNVSPSNVYEYKGSKHSSSKVDENNDIKISPPSPNELDRVFEKEHYLPDYYATSKNLGKMVHKHLEYFLHSGKIPQITEPQIAELFTLLVNADWFQKQVIGATVVKTEVPVHHDGNLGRIDILTQNNGEYAIFDLKCYKEIKDENLESFKEQLDFYKDALVSNAKISVKGKYIIDFYRTQLITI